jgi:hypothetical protein
VSPTSQRHVANVTTVRGPYVIRLPIPNFSAPALPISENPCKQCEEKCEKKLLIYRVAAMHYRYNTWISKGATRARGAQG